MMEYKSTGSARNEIMGKLRKGRSSRSVDQFPEPEWNTPVFPEPVDLLGTFVNELESIQGKVIVGDDMNSLVEKMRGFLSARGISHVYCFDESLNALLAGDLPLISDTTDFLQMEAGLTRCECLVARTGSVMVSSAHPSGRRMNVFPPLHIVWAHASQLVPFVDDAIRKLMETYSGRIPSQVSLITGPSRTADIEKTLVLGAHGPRELLVVINRNA